MGELEEEVNNKICPI